MRTAIRNKLIAKIPEISGRVYEPSMAGPSVDKPYVVVKSSGDIPTNIDVGFEVQFEVWVYSERTSFKDLDALESKAIRSLVGVDMTSITGNVFELRYLGSSPDFYDEDWKALTRQLRFSTNRVRGG